jgi:hypothetical protein
MPSQFVGKTKPEEPAAPRAPVDREKPKHRSQSHEEWAAKRLAEALGRVRIAARHAEIPLSRRDLADVFEDDHLPEDLMNAAYEAGRRDRAAGVRCMCAICEGQGQRAGDAERARGEYAQRRLSEQMAAGVTFTDAMRQIDIEIAEGKATE